MGRAMNQDGSTITVQRVALTKQAGTDDSNASFAAVAGMSGLEYELRPVGVNQVDTEMGQLSGQRFEVEIAGEHLPVGGVIQLGDRLVTDAGVVYTIDNVSRVDLQSSVRWSIRARLQVCPGTP